MKKIILITALFIWVGTALPQKLKIAVGGGMSIIQDPPQWTNPLDELGSDFNKEFNISAKVKFGIPLFPIAPVAGVTYYIMKGEMESQAGEFKKSLNLLSIQAGGEYSILPGPFSPYAGLDLQYNYFMEGEEEFPGGTAAFSGSGTRIGLGLGAGIDLRLLPFVGIDFNIKYNLMNLIGKQDNEPKYNILNINMFLTF